jgi:hypothetical protein
MASTAAWGTALDGGLGWGSDRLVRVRVCVCVCVCVRVFVLRQVVMFVEAIIARGFAYESNGSVYFHTAALRAVAGVQRRQALLLRLCAVEELQARRARVAVTVGQRARSPLSPPLFVYLLALDLAGLPSAAAPRKNAIGSCVVG